MEKLDNLKKDINKILDKDLRILKSYNVSDDFITLFKNSFLNTIDTTVTYDDDTFIITGDIDAMWLRDSTCQILQYLKYIKESDNIKEFIKSLIIKQFSLILIDPYANAFNKTPLKSKWINDETIMNDYIWERKYELDSITFPIHLLNTYYKETNDNLLNNRTVIDGIKKCVDTFIIEQNHIELSPYRFVRHKKTGDYLINNGMGPTSIYTGMVSSMFRPSDDPVKYPYLIPSNIFLLETLKTFKELLFDSIDSNYQEKINKLINEIDNGINKYGIKNTKEFGDIYYYEVDGMGNTNFMDDANMPSLLSLPIITSISKDDKLYKNTRKAILSENNPYYFIGLYARGIGSPHTKDGYIWPIALACEGLTSESKEDKLRILDILSNTHANTFYMHESFNKDNPSEFSRSWFSWANTMFSLLVIDYYEL